MRKIITLIICFTLVFASVGMAFAEEVNGTTTTEQTTQVGEQPAAEVTPVTGTNDQTTTTTTEGTTQENTTTTVTPTDGTTTDGTAQEGTTTGDATTTPVDETTTDQAGVTPDSIIYPIEKMVESVQVTLTTNEANKAELLVQFADERLAEAQIMTAEDKLALAEKVMKTYAETLEKANAAVEAAAGDDADVSNLIEKIEITEENGNTVIKITAAALSQEAAQQIQTAITAQVKKTIAVQGFLTAKAKFFEAKDAFKAAQEALKKARKSGDDAAIAAAEAQLALAKQQKEAAEQLKDAAEAYKENIKQGLEEDQDIDQPADDADNDNGNAKAVNGIEKRNATPPKGNAYGHDKEKHGNAYGVDKENKGKPAGVVTPQKDTPKAEKVDKEVKKAEQTEKVKQHKAEKEDNETEND